MSNEILSKAPEILQHLKRLKVHTNSLMCMGCGREHNCSIHGCQIIRDAMELITAQEKQIGQLAIELGAAVDAIPQGCATCEKFQGGACPVLFYQDLQSDGCEHWAWRGPRKEA